MKSSDQSISPGGVYVWRWFAVLFCFLHWSTIKTTHTRTHTQTDTHSWGICSTFFSQTFPFHISHLLHHSCYLATCHLLVNRILAMISPLPMVSLLACGCVFGKVSACHTNIHINSTVYIKQMQMWVVLVQNSPSQC